MADVVFRQADLSDAADIHTLLLQIAPEIPVLADTLEREEALYAVTRTCARSGESWVALDEGGRFIGFLLAERSEAGRHYAEHEQIEIRHAGIVPEYRGRGLFREMVQRVLTRLVPVAVSISPHNRFAVGARLERLGFTPDRGSSEQRYHWQPG